jgi:predicted dehydrogenase
MVREARRLVRDGSLGKIRKIVVEYSQGWLSEAVEKTGHKQATWRADPKQSGTGGAIADIGVHAFNLLEYVSGLRVAELCASLSASRSDRLLDDDCNVLAKLDNGAPAVIFVSQIAAGERNNLRLHVYGEKGGLHWAQENPNLLHINWLDRPSQTLHAAAGYLSQDALSACRLPVGHPEGLIEAFANIYRDFASAFIARQKDSNAALSDLVPGIDDGVRGMMFIDRAVKSSREHSGWVKL